MYFLSTHVTWNLNIIYFIEKKVFKPLQVLNYFLRCVLSSHPTHTLGYYKEESIGGGSKILARGFEPKIL